MLFLAVTAAVAVGFTLGWRTRLMSILLYLCMLSLYHRNVSSNGGPDAVPMILTLLHDVLPVRSGLFARRAASGQETRDRGRAARSFPGACGCCRCRSA